MPAKSIRRAVREQLPARDAENSQSVPRVVPIRIDNRQCFVRLYPVMDPAELPYFRRHLLMSQILAHHNIRVPNVIASQLFMLDSTMCFLIVLDAVPGDKARAARISPEVSRDLGRSLAQWHSLDGKLFQTQPPDPLFSDDHYLARCRESFDYATERIVDSYEHATTLIDRAIGWLEDPGFLGDLVVGHGDFKGGNLLMDEQHVYWIDLEVAQRYPRHDDLCNACIRLLHRAPSGMKAFEDAYFAAQPDRLEFWKAHRLQSFRFVLLRNACWKFRPPRRKRKGTDDISISTKRLASACRQIAMAEAAFNVEDRGQSTYVLCREIRERSLPILERRVPEILRRPRKSKRR